YPTIAPDVGSTEVRASARQGSRAGTYELLVVAADRPGLLSWIAGALALAGLSILTAQAFTTDDGVAVDLFEVEGVFESEIDDARWREFRGVLRRAVEGRLSLDHRVAEKRSRYPGPRSDAPITVIVDNDVSDYSTVIEVGAPDRIGLLYDITSALAELTLDVHLAKVATYTNRVIDSFYVRDALGRKVTEARQVDEIESAVRSRLER
ncbi:MAG: ACT domain-containing protein, partial [Actinomycetota bacterium]